MSEQVSRPKETEDVEESEALLAESGPDNGALVLAVDSAINAALSALRTKNDGTVKTSIADLVRLLQLRKELGTEKPRKITIRWIDS